MKLVILGAGESGAGTAILAQKQGYEVFVSDMGQIKDKYKKVLDIITSVGRKASILRLRFFLPQRLLRVRAFLIQLLW